MIFLSFLQSLDLNFASNSRNLFTSLIPPLLILFIYLFKCLHFSTCNISSTKKSLPPSPFRFPIIGNVYLLGTQFHCSLWSLAQSNGPVMLLHFGQLPVLIISSPDGAREILKNNDLSFASRPVLRNFKRLLYQDVITLPYGEQWKQMKSVLVVRLLNKKRIQNLQSLREEETALLIKKIHELSSLSMAVDFRDLFYTLINDVACTASFGKKYMRGENGEKLKYLLSELAVILGSFTFGDYIPMLGWLDYLNGMDRRVKRVAKGIDEFLEGLIEERAALLEMQRARGESSDEDGENFVDTILKIQKDDTSNFISRDNIKGVLLDVYVGGTEAISVYLEWVMTELLRSPNSMKKLQNEVREVLNGKMDITEDDLDKMKYLKAVIKETLRMHPPLTLLIRTTKHDTKLMGYDIDAGTMVLVNNWGISNDPKFWDKPHEFRPERFLDSCIEFNGHDIEFTPFGAGRRQCPGTSFATAIIEYVLANLVYKFNWELPGAVKGEDMDMTEYPGSALHRKRNSLRAIATPISY